MPSVLPPLLARSIEGKKRELDSLRPFPPHIVRTLGEQFDLEWTYNSNAIEGNTLTLQETELVLSRGITIGNKSLREHFEALNHRDAIQFVQSFVKNRQNLDKKFILNLHKLILKNIDEANAGSYRTTNVMIVGARHIPPAAHKIAQLMDGFLEWFYQSKNEISVAELAALAHYKLVHIHPFIDGNGRTARLLMNLILIQNGYPPAVILNIDRKRYYKALKEADTGNLAPFVGFVGRSVERSLLIYLNALKSQNDTQDKFGYIPLAEAAQICGKSQARLSNLARLGKLSAVKMNGVWLTTREALGEMG
jgi:Fic family protein